jgi:predicted PurR-regulated permease PerM
MKLWRARPATPPPGARKALTGPDRKRAVEEAIPLPVEIAGQWGWRLLAVTGVLVVVGLLIINLRLIVIPFMIAILISALLVPFKGFLIKHHWPRWLAVLVALLLAVLVIGGLVFVIVIQVRVGLPEIERKSVAAYANFKSFLEAPPFNISKAQYTTYLNDISSAIQKNTGVIGSAAGAVLDTVTKIFTGLLLTLFATIFLVLDGGRIWKWVVGLFPRRARVAVDGAGQAGWVTLTAFIRVQIFVAFVDAVGIGLGALLLGLPLAIPIAIVVFLGSFIPVVGAIVTGIASVFIALVYAGPLQALIMLGVVLIVHLLEGNFLHPFITGNAVKVHPLAVVFAVAAGSFVAGIPGALFAVPVVAVANVMIKYLAAKQWQVDATPDIKDVSRVTTTVKTDE